MRLRVWYARRAVPWPAVGACLATTALGAGVTRWHEHLAALVLPLAALLAAAAAVFTLDDTAAPVTRVTPRGTRWSTTTRLLCAVVVAMLGLVAIACTPGSTVRSFGWPLVVVSLSVTVLAVAAWLTRGRHPTPGAGVATVMVLLGLVPFPASTLLRWGWPYPDPALSGATTGVWSSLLVITVAALGWAVLRPLPAPDHSGGRHAAATAVLPRVRSGRAVRRATHRKRRRTPRRGSRSATTAPG